MRADDLDNNIWFIIHIIELSDYILSTNKDVRL
jgi:hypothetical protein